MVNGESSCPGRLNSSVPQGSILGPLLFICYINDLPDVLRHTTPFIYADDTALIASGKTPSEISSKLNNDAVNVGNWFNKNQLSCNVKKTKAQLFCNSRYRAKDEPLNINMSGQHVEDVNCFKYLGVHLDSHLTFVPHAQKVAAKVKACTSTLWRCRSFIPQSLAHSLYSSLIEPHYIYGCIHYDGGSAQAKKILQTSQNKALRAVLCVEPRYPTGQLHATLSEPYVADICKYHTSCFAYRGLNNISTPTLNERYSVVNRNMGLRSEASVKFERTPCRTVFCTNSIFQRSHTYWSRLQPEIKNSSSLHVFKKGAKHTFYTYY